MLLDARTYWACGLLKQYPLDKDIYFFQTPEEVAFYYLKRDTEKPLATQSSSCLDPVYEKIPSWDFILQMEPQARWINDVFWLSRSLLYAFRV